MDPDMKFLHRDDNALTLASRGPGRLAFTYRSRMHALLFGAFAIVLIYVVWRYGDTMRSVHSAVYWFSVFLAVSLSIGTLITLSTRCRLDIDASGRQVRYSRSTPFGKVDWQRDFGEFKEVRIYRPLSGSGRAGHASHLKVLLTTTAGEEIPLGVSLGGTSRREARDLAQNISEIMSLTIVEESSLE
ncbi:MAG: hypothetical protein Kow0062_23410 [Acidobacteriota bacterium]